jgi:N-acetyl-anhydromuramyl-L-alanine amidase AmpD
MTLTITRRSAGDNFHAGRAGTTIDMIVIHVTEGNRSSVRDWFGNDGSDVSAHYQVCTDGTIDQFVDENDTAFHAGRVLNPTAPLVLARPGVNPNLYAIGIEHEGDGRHELAPKQRAASLELQLDICRRRPAIALSRRHIVGHHEVFAAKTCPGAIDVDRLVAELQSIAPSASRPVPPLVVWSEFANDWLVVTRVVSDSEWYFTPLSAVRRGTITRAQTPLSAMPR